MHGNFVCRCRGSPGPVPETTLLGNNPPNDLPTHQVISQRYMTTRLPYHCACAFADRCHVITRSIRSTAPGK